MKSKLISIIAIMFLLVPFSGMAISEEDQQMRENFQNYRIGPFFSLGLGFGYSSYDQTYTDDYTLIEQKISDSPTGVGLDFKLGLSFSLFQMYLHGKSIIYEQNGEETEFSDRDYFVGGGISYYFSPNTPSLYLTASLGFLSDTSAFSLGMGFEFSKYFSLEVSTFKGSYEKNEGQLKSDYWAFMCTLNFNFYLTIDAFLEILSGE